MVTACDRVHGASAESVQFQLHLGADPIRDRALVFQ